MTREIPIGNGRVQWLYLLICTSITILISICKKTVSVLLLCWCSNWISRTGLVFVRYIMGRLQSEYWAVCVGV